MFFQQSSLPEPEDWDEEQAREDRYAQWCEATALDASLPAHYARLPYATDAQAPSQRLLDIVQQRRSFPGRYTPAMPPLGSDFAQFGAAPRARALRGSSSSSSGSEAFRQSTRDAAVPAGKATLDSIRHAGGQLQRALREHGAGSALAPFRSDDRRRRHGRDSSSSSGGSAAGKGAGRAWRLGAKLLPVLPLAGPRPRR